MRLTKTIRSFVARPVGSSYGISETVGSRTIPMDIDPSVAAALGFPKLRYVFIERERRWICTSLPLELVTETERITDLYVTGSNLRLREARPLSDAPPLLRLTRKVDVDARTRLISSINLQESEFALLQAALVGCTIRKRRHRLRADQGTVLAVDEFEGSLAGLMLLEVEFPSLHSLEQFEVPLYAGAEVTGDSRFIGASLAAHGAPDAQQLVLP